MFMIYATSTAKLLAAISMQKHGRMKIAYKISVRKSEGKRSIGRTVHRCRIIFKLVLKKHGASMYIQLTQNRSVDRLL